MTDSKNDVQTRCVSLPNASTDEKWQNISDEEGVEDIPGEEGRVTHHDTPDAGTTTHTLTGMTKPPFPATGGTR